MKNLLEIDPKDIQVRKDFNTRYDLGDLRELKISMENKGFDASHPLIVSEDKDNPGKYLLGAQGHRRLTVALDLNLPMVYAVLEDEDLSDSDRNLDIVRLNNGEPLPMLAVARVVERALKEEGVLQQDVAKQIGKTAAFVGDCVRLNQTTKQTQKWIEQDKISAYSVIDIIRELNAKNEEGYKKVEAMVEKLIKKAGDKKVTKKVKEESADEETESEEDRAAREAQEAADKEETKRNKAIVSRALKFVESVKAMVEKSNDLPEGDELSHFQSALLDLQVATAAYLSGQTTDTARNLVDGESTKLSDIGVAQRAVEKAHKETVKETETEAKDNAKAKLEETKEAAAKRIADVKAKAKK